MAKKGTISLNFVVGSGAGGLRQLTLDADQLRSVMEQNVRVAQRAQSGMTSLAKTAIGLQGLSNTAGQLSGMLNTLTGESMQFNSAMKAANTMAGKDAAGFKEMKSQVADLAKEIPVARDALANGLYQVISNGVPEDNWLTFLEASARSSVGGIADLGQVVGVTSTLIKNYGLEWSAAADLQDKIQLTAKNGVTSFEQLAAALPRVTGNAATLGVSIDELMASFATLTGVSGNTAEVSTQLAAIFTALVKPSSEATKMAEAMGIQFDAAAIKAAGGMQQFLTSLDASVKSYAATSGVLEQEVYAKLFGSAESLRALVPLQGELAESFSRNVAAMTDSAGTMDAAYADMASTGESVMQILKNQTAALTDMIATVAGAAQPYVAFTSQLLTGAAALGTVTTAVKGLNVQKAVLIARSKLAGAAMLALGLKGKSSAAAIRVMSAAMKSGAFSATALKIALRGLLMATGIGLAITAVTTAIEYFTNSAEEASEAAKELSESQEVLKSSTDEFTRTAAEAKVSIDNEAKKLKELIDAHADTSAAVAHLNETYGSYFGTCNTASEWYDRLTKKSSLYAKQLGYEAKARLLATKIAEASLKKEELIKEREKLSAQSNNKPLDKGEETNGGFRSLFTTPFSDFPHLPGYEESVIAAGELITSKKAEIDEATASIESMQAELEDVVKKQAEVMKELSEGTITPAAPPKISEMTHSQVTDRISEIEKEMKNTLDEGKIKSLKAERAKLEARKAKLDAVLGLGSTKSAATSSVSKNNTPKAEPEAEPQLEEPFKELKVEAITTYKQLDEQLNHYNELLEEATVGERDDIQSHINDLEDLRRKWDNLLSELRKPGDIGTLDTFSKVDDALAYWQQKMQSATAEERHEIQQTIDALQRKRDAMSRPLDISGQLHEAQRTEGKSGADRKRAIADIGYEQITDNIRQLREMLDNPDMPMLEAQKEQVEELIELYTRWQGESINVADTMREGYERIKDFASGFETIKDALTDSQSVWESITGVIDGFLQSLEGIQRVVDLINMLNTALGVQNAVKKKGTDATKADTTATAANTLEAAANTSAKSGEAVAEATASGASLPFPANLGAIAAAVAAVVSALSIVGSFATGGIVGGSSPSGDRLLARVNSGEMILNQTQQRRLFAMLDGRMSPRALNIETPQRATPTAALEHLRSAIVQQRPVVVGGTLRASGRELVCVIENETRISGKSGKKYKL